MHCFNVDCDCNKPVEYVQCECCGEVYPKDFGYCYDCDDEPDGWSVAEDVVTGWFND